MKSPFPGMDPYLEAHWGDVHTSLITYARDLLRPQLPGDLKVRVEERISVQDHDEDDHSVGYFPDVRVIERPESEVLAPAAHSELAVAEPILVPRLSEAPTERSLQIIDARSGNRVITTVEVLSPTNKSDSQGRSAFRKKQQQLSQADVNLIEIDLLLRDESYVLIAPWEAVPNECRGTYRVAVSRASDPDHVEMYRVPLRHRLPMIRIPLRPTDSDVLLDIQSLIDLAYENGGYDDIDYRLDPLPPLSLEDAEWAASLLREANLR